MCVPGRDEIAHDVLSYLNNRSKAGDTLEGIVEWWLLEMEIRRSLDDVKSILDELVEAGLIVQYQGPDTRVHYRTRVLREQGADETNDEE